MIGFGTTRQGTFRPRKKDRIAMLLENNPYPEDVRVRAEAVSLAAKGWRVVVVAPRAPHQSRRQECEGVEVRRFHVPDGASSGKKGFVVEYAIAVVALHIASVRELMRGARILHLHNPPDVLFLAGALFRMAGRSVVFDHHDLFPETVETKFGPGISSRIAGICERLTFAVASHVLAPNESHAEIAVGRGQKPRGAVTIVRNAPPATWLDLPLQVRSGVLDCVHLAYLGAVARQDGVTAMARVLALLRSRGLKSTLTIIGDGDARPEFEAQLNRFGVADLVKFTGWIEHKRVPQRLLAADICVDPAPASEVNRRSTMIKIAEYLAVGKPVVAYDMLETRRTAAGAALLVPPGDIDGFANQISALARDPDLRLRLAQQARERAADLVWDHSEAALLSTYDRLRCHA